MQIKEALLLKKNLVNNKYFHQNIAKHIINIFLLLLGLKLQQYNTKLVQLNRLFSSQEDAKRRLEESKTTNEELQIQIVINCKHLFRYT